MEEENDVLPDVEQRIRDQIDDEMHQSRADGASTEQRDDRNDRDGKSGSRRR
jgi:hypothetical protein